jgi:hypothetical protein
MNWHLWGPTLAFVALFALVAGLLTYGYYRAQTESAPPVVERLEVEPGIRCWKIDREWVGCARVLPPLEPVPGRGT